MRSRRRLIGWVIVLALVVASGWVIVSNRDDDAVYAEVTSGRIEQAIETTGTFRAAESVVVRVELAGKVDTVAVRPGDRVVAGDIVAILDRTALEGSVERAGDALVEAELAASLARERAASANDADLAAAILAEVQADAARDALKDAESALAAAIMVAPATGTVLDVPIAEGESYPAGATAAVIAGDAFELAASLDQADLPLVAAGDRVRVIPDALPDLELDGTIAEIAPRGEQEGGAVRFAITVSLSAQPAPDAGLRVGMTARVIIPAVAVEAALLVPSEAVETIGRRSFVRVLRDGDEVSVEVSLGLRQGGLVQIAAGDLVAGDRVRVPS